MEAILTDCVQNNLHNFMYRNAIFICERLCAEFPSEVNLQQLAMCYLHNNQAYAAYHLLKGTQMAQSRYLFALSCFQMDLLKEAEAALCPSDESSIEVPNGAAGHYLLGLTHRYTDRRKRAVHHLKQALLLDPLFWAAYEELCILGYAEEAGMIYSESAAISVQKQQLQRFTAETVLATREDWNKYTQISEDANSRHLKSMSNVREGTGTFQGSDALGGIANQLSNSGPFNLAVFTTPSPVTTLMLGAAPPPLCRNVQPNIATSSTDNSPPSIVNPTRQAPRRKLQKISGSLFSDSSSREETCQESFEDSSSKETSTSFPSSEVKSCDQDGRIILTSSSVDEASEILKGAIDIMALLKHLGEGYRLFCLYQCQEALKIYQRLPYKHYNTGWVLSQVGKACYELVDYAEADLAFSLARRLYPYSLEGMDVYSTVLYHLKEDTKLSYLARELLSTDRLAPQTWCAMGNYYSMQKDHDVALKNLKRAIQLNSRFTYAYTLCGHEYTATEDFENGIKSYQSALRVDPRHYNAWYGLGMVYLRQEKIELSEHSFRIALQINPHSSVLMSYLGTALHALQRNEEALMMMEKAIIADKKNPLPMFHKATILVSMERLDEALEVLEELKEYAPRECSIYALMGKIYKQCRMYDKAMFHFGLALDLKPAAADVIFIRTAMERLLVPDDVDDE